MSKWTPTLENFFTAPDLIASMPVQTRRRAALQETPVKPDASATKKSSAKSKSAQKLPVREKEEDEVSTPTKGTLKVFDDEDEDEANAPIESSLNPAAETAEAAEDKQDEEEEDSDDEAPEAVSTTKAAEEIKKSAQVAQQAAKEYVPMLPITSFSDSCFCLTIVPDKLLHKSASVNSAMSFSRSKQRSERRLMRPRKKRLSLNRKAKSLKPAAEGSECKNLTSLPFSPPSSWKILQAKMRMKMLPTLLQGQSDERFPGSRRGLRAWMSGPRTKW